MEHPQLKYQVQYLTQLDDLNCFIGYTIVSAITFVFPPNTILPPSSFYVIAANVSEFETAYAMPPNQTYSVCTLIIK